MTSEASSVSESVQRLSCRDPTLASIGLDRKQYTDAELKELVDCLLAHPDVVTHVWLGMNQLTDETGVKLARYLAASSTIELLSLSANQLYEETYLALAAALRVNSSLCRLFLDGNDADDQTRIEAAFIDALRLNPHRPAGSMWRLYQDDWKDIDFERLRDAAEQLGHPSLQLLLTLLC